MGVLRLKDQCLMGIYTWGDVMCVSYLLYVYNSFPHSLRASDTYQ